MTSNTINIAANIKIQETLSRFAIPILLGFLTFFVCLLSLLFLDMVNILDGLFTFYSAPYS